jgi:ABC-2 type transport system ATP-binding protein
MTLGHTAMTATTQPAAPRESAPAIAVTHLSHHYRPSRRATSPPRPALDDVSFTVNPGEIFGILGPNGGGKTTLFRILCTMLRPNPTREGAATIFGHDVLRQPDLARTQLGVVFQQPSLDIKLTAEENLRHQGRLYGLSGANLRARIDRQLQLVGLAERRHDYVEKFSGGMRRRVELAKALIHEPRLLLMDEPATGLDPGARREMWRQLESLRATSGVTIAMTTHLMDEAERCDRLAILAQGKLLAIDKPAHLKAAIGGDVITVEPDAALPDNQPEKLAQLITDRFGPWPNHAAPKVMDHLIRFEKDDGAQMIAAIASAFPGRIRSVTVGRPTLEDVFLHLTGSAFWNHLPKE